MDARSEAVAIAVEDHLARHQVHLEPTRVSKVLVIATLRHAFVDGLVADHARVTLGDGAPVVHARLGAREAKTAPSDVTLALDADVDGVHRLPATRERRVLPTAQGHTDDHPDAGRHEPEDDEAGEPRQPRRGRGRDRQLSLEISRALLGHRSRALGLEEPRAQPVAIVSVRITHAGSLPRLAAP